MDETTREGKGQIIIEEEEEKKEKKRQRQIYEKEEGEKCSEHEYY